MKNDAQRVFLALTAIAMSLFAHPALNQAVEPAAPPLASAAAGIPAVAQADQVQP